jgi:hypothetical protein
VDLLLSVAGCWMDDGWRMMRFWLTSQVIDVLYTIVLQCIGYSTRTAIESRRRSKKKQTPLTNS